MKRWLGWIGWAALLGLLLGLQPGRAVAQQELDFRQRYERGKLLLKRKLYADAIAEFRKASYTTEGRTHFGVYYYMAKSYFWLPDIRKANQALQIAKKYAKEATHREALQGLTNQIQQLYTRVAIAPQVDPDEVGRLQLVLKPKISFSNSHKRRYFQILNKRLKGTGVIPNNRPFYVPKGDYEVSIAPNQCLRYTLKQEGQRVSEVTLGDGLARFFLTAGRSCSCTGGQKMYGKGAKLYCACPPGTGWNKDKQRCEVGVNPVPWVLAGVGVVVAGAAAVIIGLVVAQNDGTDYRLLRNPNAAEGDKTRLWK